MEQLTLLKPSSSSSKLTQEDTSIEADTNLAGDSQPQELLGSTAAHSNLSSPIMSIGQTVRDLLRRVTGNSSKCQSDGTSDRPGT
ncbi:hypothetical protein H5410_034073 [Solanum commersonii]|uniref:Uncharacterized protein n=1 Tax=Solanum commersonii TaxID=4109 RepID=A0A9J5YSD9_SOLCO|nr:hypothetical protein H5410_034073 [Solanum commersonii]